MRETGRPEDVEGYVAVSLPELGAWQGFFVVPALAPAADEVLRLARSAANAGGGGGAGAETLAALPGVVGEDQPLVGALCALVVAAFERGCAPGATESPEAARRIERLVGGGALALARAVGHPWLLVEGTRDRFRGGVRASVERIAADGLDAAREAVAGEIARRRRMREAGGAFVESLANAAPRRRGGP